MGVRKSRKRPESLVVNREQKAVYGMSTLSFPPLPRADNSLARKFPSHSPPSCRSLRTERSSSRSNWPSGLRYILAAARRMCLRSRHPVARENAENVGSYDRRGVTVLRILYLFTLAGIRALRERKRNDELSGAILVGNLYDLATHDRGNTARYVADIFAREGNDIVDLSTAF